MIQLQILSGGAAGGRCVARRFPFRIGRAPDAHLRLDEPGVWDAHAEIQFQRGDGYHLAAQANAWTLVNGERSNTVRLRNGDLIDLGGARLRFWLAEAVQKRLRARAGVSWLLITAVALGEITIIYALL